MPTTRNSDSLNSGTHPADDRLARLLDDTALDRAVPHLAPETLHQIVRHRGLHASADVLAAATPAQLAALADLDLWQQAPGHDAAFDADRFGEWLEALGDVDDATAARTLAALDSDIVVTGLSRYVRVFDPGIFEPIEPSDDEAPDRHTMMTSEGPADGPECELGGYLLRARRADAWDAVVNILSALEASDSETFHAVMEGCRRLSNSTPEVDGLDDLLQAPDQHLYDVAHDRDARRSRRGYATAPDARAFLQLARQSGHRPSSSREADTHSVNPIAAAYFRALHEEHDDVTEAGGGQSTQRLTGDAGHSPDDGAASADAIVEVLTGIGAAPGRPRALLEAGDRPHTERLPVLKRLMTALLDRDEHLYYTRTHELAFLTNALQSGASVQSRALTHQEAADGAASTCNLGLECWPTPIDERFLERHNLIETFEAGWSVLYRDVSLFVAGRLQAILAELTNIDAHTAAGIRTLRRKLAAEHAAGTPWLARDAAEVLALLDAATWTAIVALIDECPTVPAAMTAMVGHATTAVSPTQFEFIATAAQLGDIRRFMQMVPDALGVGT